MPANRALELGTGLFVALGFSALFFLTTQLPGSGLRWGSESGYLLTAKFENVGDLREGSPVAMAGVRIGRVTQIGFDPDDFRAVVTMRIDPRYDRIPDDSDASIQTQGLLGGKFIGIGAGGSETYLKDGGQIEFTQSAVVLESLINRFFASFASRGNEQAAAQGQAGDGEPAAAQQDAPGADAPRSATPPARD